METPNENETPETSQPNQPDEPTNTNPIDSFLSEISGGVASDAEEQDHSDDAAHDSASGLTVDFDKWWSGQVRLYPGWPVFHFQIDKPFAALDKSYTAFNTVATPEIVAKWVELQSAGQVNLNSKYGSSNQYAACEIAGDPDNPEKGFLIRLGGERYRLDGMAYDGKEYTTAQIIGE